MNDPSQLEQRLRAATSRSLIRATDEETRGLHQAYSSLGELLESQPNEVDEAALLGAVLDRDAVAVSDRSARRESYLAMLSMAASFLLLIALAVSQFDGAKDFIAVGPTSGNGTPTVETAPTETVDPQLVWDDDWDSRFDEVRDYAAEFHFVGYSRMESTSYSALEVLRELQAELNPDSM